MINILVPMAGKSLYFPESEYPFPKTLIEISQKTMIEHVVYNLETASPKVQFIFIISNSECRKFHIDNILNIITNQKCKIVKLDNDTKGAACSALMAVSHIDNETPLIIANSDQLFDNSISELLVQMGDADAGVVTFESVHPRWSYVRIDDQGFVKETSEKRPISRHAIAGLYYFKHGKEFVAAAKAMILKDSNENGVYYIAPSLNELILSGKKIKAIEVSADKYHTFYTPNKVKEYESHVLKNISKV